MRLLLDINMLLDVPLQRPGATASGQLIAMCGRQHEAWLAWHSVATLAYLIERQPSAVSARDFIGSMLEWADIAMTGRADAQSALSLPMADFEDALQVVAAQACGAQYIVTRNERDFRKSPVPALSPEAFLRKHRVRPARPAS